MSLFITSLNSGSNGNCYYIGNLEDAILIDAGISCRETENRLERLGLSLNNVRAIFITHEHTDHTGGAEVISRRYQIPVYITEKTYKHSRLNLENVVMETFRAYEPIQVGNLTVNPFPKRHDASDAHSFTITSDGITVGVLTDLGSVCEHVILNFSKCHAVFLEANYDEVMLEEGSYPPFLKARIKSDHGHLSNIQALQLFTTHKSPLLSHLLLSHLSRDNNSQKLVMDLFSKHAGGTKVAIASRYGESPVYMITGAAVPKVKVDKTNPEARQVIDPVHDDLHSGPKVIDSLPTAETAPKVVPVQMRLF